MERGRKHYSLDSSPGQYGYSPHYEVPLTAVEKMERTITSYTKNWLGVPRCFTNISLYGKGVLELLLTSLTEEYKCSKERLQLTEGFQTQDHQCRCTSPSNWAEVDTIRCSAASYISPEAQRHCGADPAGKRLWPKSKWTNLVKGYNIRLENTGRGGALTGGGCEKSEGCPSC